ncbi:uncharacterized protein LOC129588212 [Paramacrobiotus metropolitanus]|uniref:uncharacterized protein LOC129588212 n=1 Tax=Paramacrobiotus metropolitanus TaxID=2943436 RepID=UPI0024456618|nr:uncharacterized protein LOC129588212 [Paramacrobiotus metropolitanus]
MEKRGNTISFYCHASLFLNQVAFAEKFISFSWQAEYKLSFNESHQSFEELPPVLLASGSQINGTANADAVFPDDSSSSVKHIIENSGKDFPPSLPGFRFRRAAETNNAVEQEPDFVEDLQISPELKVQLYTGVILTTIGLIVFVLCIWPLFVCLRSCWRYSTTCCLSCWDLLNCRDPGYRIMCLAAKQNGLDPPTPEEYDRFMSGWEDRAPELLETLMES